MTTVRPMARSLACSLTFLAVASGCRAFETGVTGVDGVGTDGPGDQDAGLDDSGTSGGGGGGPVDPGDLPGDAAVGSGGDDRDDADTVASARRFDGLTGGLYAATDTRYYVQVVEQAGQTACAITEDPALSPEGASAQVWVTLETDFTISGCPDGLYPFIGPCDGRALDEGDACASYRLFDARGRVVRHLEPVGGSLEIIDPVGPDGCTLSLELTLPGGITVRETFVTDDVSSFDDDPVCGPA